ncbi:MAG TPA: hypothetical protein VFC47_06485 [Caulobacteraceae bacterium]|nr:hypothetical protein [Caulobacteraceae bacterium]
MDYTDPDTPRTIEVHTEYDPVRGTTTQVRRTDIRSNAAAWWVAGLVTVVAIIAIAFMVTRPTVSTAGDQAIAAAADQGRAQGAAESAQNAATLAQTNAQASLRNSQATLRNDADRAAAARQRAEATADQAATNADAAGRDSAATTPGPTPAPGDSSQ